MNKNMGSIDRGLRIIVAIVLAVLIYTGTLEGVLAAVALVVAAVFVLTSLVGTCPAYRLVGLSTCGKQ